MFDPNEPCAPNGNFFGFPYSSDDSDLVLLTVPWDVTTSYQAGAADGPEAILNASYQLDFFDFHVEKAWECKIGTAKTDFSQIRETSRKMRPIAQKVIEKVEDCATYKKEKYSDGHLDTIELASTALNEWVEEKCDSYIKKGKKVGIIGGDHSVPLGLYKSIGKTHDSWGILHIDAHADLRNAYEGFSFSHASIMYNALSIGSLKKLVQLGIRDVCEKEIDLINKDKRITVFSDYEISNRLFNGDTWAVCVRDIISTLPDKVYISFDIDGLDPKLCPHTGTPVPGGLSFAQIRYLIYAIMDSGKEIIGFDLCEVAPNKNDKKDEWDGNVGARVLFLLSLSALHK